MSAVQPPTREQIAVDLIEKLRKTGGVPIDSIWERWWQLFREYDAVLALFPQPTPSADQIISLCPRCGGSGCVGLADCRLCWGSGEVSNPAPFAEPVSIADMAPGTTLWARFVDEDHDRFLVIVNEPEWPVLDPIAADQWQYSHVDPSTIRDVTPPAATPEADR